MGDGYSTPMEIKYIRGILNVLWNGGGGEFK
jgi:hypothetical protein